VFRDVVDAVRYESDGTRRWIHRLRRVPACDFQVRVEDGGRFVVSGTCLCREFFVDMLVEADRFLAARSGPPLRNPPGAVRVHVRTRTGDWTRTRRVDAGAQARTDRVRGSAIAATLPDDYHRALLEYLVDEAGSLAPLAGPDALPRRLAELAADEFGGSAAQHLPRIASGLPVVVAACREARRVAPHPGATWLVTWWERYIEAPLGRRARLDDVPLDAQHHDAAAPDRADALDRAAVDTVLRVVAENPDAPMPSALHEATAELVRRDLMSPAEACSFVTDSRRMTVAAEQVRVLMAA
jgi:hypothetical protein